MTKRILRPCLAVVALLSLVATAPVTAEEGALDGRTFEVEVTDPSGETTADTLIFADGMFRSVACEEWGFEPAPYEGSETDFSATASSPEEGLATWQGTLDGDGISGSFLWEKEGQEPLEYTFEGAAAGSDG